MECMVVIHESVQGLEAKIPKYPTERVTYGDTFGHTYYATVHYGYSSAKVFLCRIHLLNDNNRFAFSIRCEGRMQNDTIANNSDLEQVYNAGIELAKQVVIEDYNHIVESYKNGRD